MIEFMSQCLELAKKGLGKTPPNPLVGAVIVHNGSVIGEGYHKQFGGPHAEVNAINSVKNIGLLKDSTLYVNLEPCCHHGKTPPCVDLILSHKIPEVVVGCRDPFSEVSGKGIEKLKTAGVKVTEGILEEESRDLNIRFITFHEKKRPYIILKWAETKDGFIAKKNYDSKWISSEESRKLVHQWRSEESAVMVGKNTAVYDNPFLTCRMVEGKNPIRILIDRVQEVPTSFHIFDESALTILFNEVEDFVAKGATLIKIDFERDVIDQIMEHLYRMDIQSVIVEGGAKLLQSFIDAGVWDEARVFKCPVLFGEGIISPKILDKTTRSATNIGADNLLIHHRDM